ncbi:MAG: CehA/McbA family metallohydrolase [Gemmataceae bacterium]|nr:CehA/McbA family metallohydrolase [Gemmataceae bacterium]
MAGLLLSSAALPRALAQELTRVEVEGQPLAANVQRLLQALAFLGSPLSANSQDALQKAAAARDAVRIQQVLDAHVLLLVTLDPESRVQVSRGPAQAVLQQGGFTPALVKVINHSTVTKPLRLSSPQAGPAYAGVATLSMTRQDQMFLKENENTRARKDRFLHLEMFTEQPMTANLSGLRVEYALALLYASEPGRRETTLTFDIGPGTPGGVPVLFDIRPAVPVKLSVLDHDGSPSTGRFTFRDRTGRVHPPQPRRLAPDLFFQQQIYRHDGETVLLPPGEFTLYYSRGPEYRLRKRQVTVPERGPAQIAIRLERWVNPADFGFCSGDHHIHAAGCAHYQVPTEGVLPQDMFRQVKGEGLNVGCVLTWGPCYQHQRQFFAPGPHTLSEPFTVLKYDVEVSGFGSQALGHVCLLNLKDQAYPGSDGTQGWPTWTTPVLRWAKKQKAYTGYAHSASGLAVDPTAAARRLLAACDGDKDGALSRAEADRGLLPEDFAAIDANRDNLLAESELAASLQRVADRLPNLAVPEMNGVGAQEIFVTVAQSLCDFISAMDTPRVAEWNCWYHILNCGFPLKVSGETDFPCMSGTRVGQGRIYVQLGKIDRVDFPAWCEGLARGRSYVSDGYAHALEYTVGGKSAGDELSLPGPATVTVRARVAFAAETPLGVAHGGPDPDGGRRLVGDTVNLHGPRQPEGAQRRGGQRLVELIVNGRVAAAQEVPADNGVHELTFSVPIERSSWVALRYFPQLHTNPVNVLLAGRPIRASRASALWCSACIEQLWRARGKAIAAAERDEAHKTFQQAIQLYQRLAAEAPEGS